jgi:chemotaxis response regulator CheB
VSSLKVGLVTSCSNESDLLVKLLKSEGVELIHNISPSEILSSHAEDENLHVWLLNVDDDSWHDAIDNLLDESEVPVYFSEPGLLAKQTHPEFWCKNLLDRLFEITGLKKDPEPKEAVHAEPVVAQVDLESNNNIASKIDNVDLSVTDTPLSNSLDELEISTVGLPSDIAAELVNELESLSPVLAESPELDLPELIENSPATVSVETESKISSVEVSDNKPKETTPEIVESENVQAEVKEENLTVTKNIDQVEPDSSEFDTLELDTLELDTLEIDTLELESADLDSFELNEIENTDIENVALDSIDSHQLGSDTVIQEIIEPDIEIVIEPEIIEDSLEIEALDVISEELVEPDLVETGLDEEPSIELMDFELEENTLDLVNETAFETNDDIPLIGDPLNDEMNDPPQLFLEPDIAEVAQPDENISLDEAQSELSFEIDSFELEYEADSEHRNELEETQESVIEDVEVKSKLTLELAATEEEIKNTKKNTGRAQFEIDQSEALPQELEELEELETVVPTLVIESPDNEADLISGLSLVDIGDENKAEPADWLKVKPDNQDDILEVEKHLVPDTGEQGSNETESEAIEPKKTELEELTLEESELDRPFEELMEETEAIFDRNSQNESSFIDNNISFTDEDKSSLMADLALDDEPENDVMLDSTQENASFEQQQASLNTPPMQAEEEVVRLSPDAQFVETVSEVDEQVEEFDIPMLDETASNIDFEEKAPVVSPVKELTPCWVIGASLGGPAAVKRFMQGIPKDINASFVVAQHIDESFLPVLAEILTNNSPFDVGVAKGSHDMTPGKVVIAPLKGKIDFLTDGSLLIDHSQKWSAPYSPCIDDVIKSVSQAYGNLAGAIIFSGMGEDGMNGAKKMREKGGLIWAQSPDTCANSSMPEAVINENLADFVGTPEELAEKLVAHLSES